MNPRLVLAALAVSCPAPGSEPMIDRGQAIEISARDSRYDVGTGEWSFAGEVLIVYGSIEARGEAGLVRQRDEQITGVELRGNPASWREVLADGREISGEADTISFDSTREAVTMTGNTQLRHARGVFTGDRLVYDVANQTLSGDSGEGGRIRVTIPPLDASPAP